MPYPGDEIPRRMTNIGRSGHLGMAYNTSIRQNELYIAIQLVESCGASPELTDAVMKLGERMTQLQRQIEREIYEVIRYDP